MKPSPPIFPPHVCQCGKPIKTKEAKVCKRCSRDSYKAMHERVIERIKATRQPEPQLRAK